MRLYVFLLLILVVALGTCRCEQKDLNGYQVVRVKTDDRNLDKNQTRVLDSLDNIFNAVLKRDVWKEYPSKGEADILVSPSERARLESAGKKLVKIIIQDLGQLIQREKEPASNKSSHDFGNEMLSLDRYHDLEDVYKYQDHLMDKYEGDVEVEKIGETYEGREIRVVKICKGGCGHRHIMFIEAGIHAREWIAPAAASYLIYRLAEEDKDENDGNISSVLDSCAMSRNFDWHIVQVANPDGYEYSRSHDRMWRKTREPPNSNWTSDFSSDSSDSAVSYCHFSDLKGTDGNRNFDMRWGEYASKYACDDDFKGAYPFSSPVSKALADYITRHKDKIAFYGALHAYSQVILVPFGTPETEVSPITTRSKRLALIGSEAMERLYGKKYEVIPAVDIGYPSSGSSMDWAVGKAGIPYGATLELRPTVEEGFGFILPPEQILPTAKEVFAYFHAVSEDLFREFGYPKEKGYVVVGSKAATSSKGLCFVMLLILSLVFKMLDAL